jgi:branched-chain amino acid transport system permease protein
MTNTTPWRGALIPLIIIAVLALAPVLAMWLDYSFLVRLLTRILLLSIVAMAMNLMLGFGGLVSLMHAGIFGVGGYVVAILAYHDFNAQPLLLAIPGSSQLAISIPLAIVAAIVISLAAGVVALRTSGLHFIMITLAFNQMLYYLLTALRTYGGEDGLQILGQLDLLGMHPDRRIPFYYLCLIVTAFTWLLLARLVTSKFGMTLRGIAQNERRMRALGFEPLRYKLTAFVISGAIAGLAGALWAANQAYISPADMSWIRSGELVVMAMLGGISMVGGPLIGAFLFLLMEFFLEGWTKHWQLPFGLLIIFMIAIFPNGVLDLPARLRILLRVLTRKVFHD